MSALANIRVNVGAPFPTLVKASGLITINKSNGIWTVGFSMANVPAMPAGTNLAAVQVLLYNTILKTYQQITLAALFAGMQVNPTRIAFANSPYAVQASDTTIYVDTAGGAIEIDLGISASRGNVPLTIKDVTGHAAANPITIKPVGGGSPETIDGYTHAAPLVLQANYDGVTLLPNTLSYVISP